MNDTTAPAEHHAASNVGLPIPINDGNGEERRGNESSRPAASSNENEGALTASASARPEQRAPLLASGGTGSRKRPIRSISIDEDDNNIGSNNGRAWFGLGVAGKFLQSSMARIALLNFSHTQPTNHHPPNHLRHSLTNGNGLNSNDQENQNVRAAAPMQASSPVPRKKQQLTVHQNWRADRNRKIRPPARPRQPLADLSNNNEHNHEDVQYQEGIERTLLRLHQYKRQYDADKKRHDAACRIQRFARGIAANVEVEEEVHQEDNAAVDEAEGISEESEDGPSNDTTGLQLSSPPSSHHDSPVNQPSTSLQAMQQDGAVEMPNDDAAVPAMETREDDADEGGAEGGIVIDEATLQMDVEEAATSAVTTHMQQKDVDLSMDCVAPCTNEDDTLVDDMVDEDTSGDGNEESNTGTIGDDAVLPHEVVNQFDTEHDGEETLDAPTAATDEAMLPKEDDMEMPQVDDAEVGPPSSIIQSSFMVMELGDDDDNELREQFYQLHGEKFERMMSCLEKIEKWTLSEGRASFVLRFAKELYTQSLESREADSHMPSGDNNVGTEEDEDEGSPNHNPQDDNDDEPAGEEEDRYYVEGVEYDEDLSDDEDEVESSTSAYTATYCGGCNLSSEMQFREIMLCYEHGMDDIENDTPEKWNELNRLVLLQRGEAPPAKDPPLTSNLLRRRFFRCHYYKSTDFNDCKPHPRFHPLEVGDIELFEGYTVRQCTRQLIRPLRDKTFEATGEKQAVFPRSDGFSRKSGKVSPAKNFFKKGGRYALLAKEITSLKARVQKSNSYIAKLILNYMKTKGGLCLDNQTAYDEYMNGRTCNDGRMLFHFGILYHCAGIELLPNMVHYDILSIVDKLYEKVVNHRKYLALQPLMDFQRQLVARLKEDINRIDEYRLMSDPTEYLIYKLCKMIWNDMPVLEDTPSADYRQSLSLLQAAHIGDEGRRAKQEIADGKHPGDCNFDLLLKQDRYLELLCAEVHLGELDQTLLASLASGADERLGSSAKYKWTTYSYREIFKARVLYLLMHKLSDGRCQLDPNYQWEVVNVTGMVNHHLTAGKKFIDEDGVEWDTTKNAQLKASGLSLRSYICSLPENEWEEFLVNELAICAVGTSHSAHTLLHFGFGPKEIDGLLDFLGYSLPWDENNTHIIKPPRSDFD